MIYDLLDSIARWTAYPRFSKEKGARTAGYIAFLSLIFVGALGVAVKLRLAPLFTETFAWLETAMPPLQFSNGTVTSPTPGPLRLEHPRVKEIALMIDTARKEPVTPAQMSDAKVRGYLTANALYLEREAGRIETIDLSKSAANRPITVDANVYKEMEKAFNWVFYPALLLFFFLAFAASIALSGLLYSLIGMIPAAGALGFGALFRIAVHAQTAGSLLYALDSVLPFTIPFFQIISIALGLTYLWRGVRAAKTASAPPPFAPPPPLAPPPAPAA